MIKTHCVSCRDRLPGTEEHYELNGNYCIICSSKAYLRAKARSGNKKAIKRLKEEFNEVVGKEDLKEIKELLK